MDTRNRMNIFILLIIMIVFIVGCGGSPAFDSGLPTEGSPTHTPTKPPVDTSTSVPLDGLPELEQISVENADQIQLITTLSISGFTKYRMHQCNTAFSPDGKYLVAACGKSMVSIWEVETLELYRTLYETQKSIVSCEFSPDSQIVGCAGYQFMDVTLWNVETGEQVERFKCDTHVFEVDFSKDGQNLVAARVNIVDPTTMTSTNGAVHLWDLSTGELLWKNETEAPRSFLSVSYHPSGEVIAFGKEAGGAGIMDVDTGDVLSYEDTEGYPNIGDLTFSPSGRLLAVGKDDFNIYVYEITDNFSLKLISTLEGHESYVNGVVFNADETLLISGSGEHDRTVGIWAVDEGFRLLNRLSGHTDSILRVDINPDGTLIASVSWDGSVNLWGIPIGSP